MKELDLKIKSDRLDELQNTNEMKTEMVRLSIKYQVLSDYTSFLPVI